MESDYGMVPTMEYHLCMLREAKAFSNNTSFQPDVVVWKTLLNGNLEIRQRAAEVILRLNLFNSVAHACTAHRGSSWPIKTLLMTTTPLVWRHMSSRVAEELQATEGHPGVVPGHSLPCSGWKPSSEQILSSDVLSPARSRPSPLSSRLILSRRPPVRQCLPEGSPDSPLPPYDGCNGYVTHDPRSDSGLTACPFTGVTGAQPTRPFRA
ncbi:hypothetical protein Taro_047409 [Colocasia esculenta]|uniref:Uncharacterized protein n=1 Tax=Colocasia esculenta TaxID=4460 RepID=A0A843WSV4_COLES|nr:hypothetical protein [Colocasia esculenta]